MHRKFHRFTHWATCSLLIVLLSFIPIRLAFAHHQNPLPQLIFVLGGPPDREVFAARIAKSHPHLNIWLSTGSPEARKVFQTAKIPASRIAFDCRATDTVTNFTTVADDFVDLGIHHVFLITSAFHMPRAKAIASIVFGSQGIAFTPAVAPDVSGIHPPESPFRILRDGVRSLLWVGIGRTGSSLNRRAMLCG